MSLFFVTDQMELIPHPELPPLDRELAVEAMPYFHADPVPDPVEPISLQDQEMESLLKEPRYSGIQDQTQRDLLHDPVHGPKAWAEKISRAFQRSQQNQS